MVALPRPLLLLGLLLGSACARASGDGAENVRFEIRGLALKKDDTEYVETFRHTATVVLHGDSAAAARPHEVVLSVRRLAGGDPALYAPNPRHAYVLVVNGVGDLDVYAGTRRKATQYSPADGWQPERVEVSVVGYQVLRSAPPATVRE